jgi:hypothetical protein
MRLPSFTKYGFRIRTRLGLVVDNLMIHAMDESDAHRKLRQMYQGCEILECIRHVGSANTMNISYENVLERIVQ